MFNTGWKNWKTVNVYPLKKRKTSSTWIGKLQVSSRNLGKQLMQLWWKLIEAAREDLRFQTRSFQNILWVKLASWSSCLLLACLDLCLETLDHHLQKIRCCSCWPRATSIYIYIHSVYVCVMFQWHFHLMWMAHTGSWNLNELLPLACAAPLRKLPSKQTIAAICEHWQSLEFRVSNHHFQLPSRAFSWQMSRSALQQQEAHTGCCLFPSWKARLSLSTCAINIPDPQQNTICFMFPKFHAVEPKKNKQPHTQKPTTW